MSDCETLKHYLMKNIIISTVVAFTTLTGFSQKKGTVEAKIQVKGICSMCENRIEETVNFAKGIKTAEWDLDSEILTVVYKEGKTTPQEIGDALAKAGHDNQYAKATEKDYGKISDCCKYKTQQKHHN